MSAFAALSLACITSSCRDQDFDWDNAHALTAQEKFTDAFIKEFGKPADNHQWGFDYNWVYNNPTTRSSTTIGNTLIVKPDPGDSEFHYIGIYGQVPDINEREHREVFDWFSTHQVNWGDKTTRIIGDLSDTSYTYKLYDGNNSLITPPSNGWTDAIRKVEKCDLGGNVIQTLTGEFFLENTNGKVEKGKIVKIEYFDGVHQTRYSGDNTTITAVKTRDLYSGNSIKPTGNTQVGLKIDFTHAWLQRIADDDDFNAFTGTDGKPDLNKYQNDEVDVFGRPQSGLNISKMTYLEIFDLTNSHGHFGDFNAGNGYGYGTGTQNMTNNNYPGLTVTQNGELVLGSNLNNLSIFNSDESKLHDKWIIVYLEGGYENDPEYGGKDTRYAGYYLGMDYEGAKGNDAQSQVGANGYCNDWIFKLTAVDPWKENVENCRIMCEDLGGKGNRVQIGERYLVSDIDYNDIVFDVTRRTPTGNIIDLTLRAAGGTLPLTVWYGPTPLFETHEFITKNAIMSDNGHTTNVDYGIMYNTGKDTSRGEVRTFSLYFNGALGINTETNRNLQTYADISTFDVGKLLIKVWRNDVDSYRSNPNNYSDAEWVNITNMNGSAPLKLCVPQTVRWLQEYEAINKGYPDFAAWVGDPTKQFWKMTVNGNYLY